MGTWRKFTQRDETDLFVNLALVRSVRDTDEGSIITYANGDQVMLQQEAEVVLANLEP